ncbi:MAG: DinB family protein [Bacteroidota bacterium]|jgi:uncharacterized damage-inducible protein DinB|nr:DinB family protein [Cytophagales bacterium]MCE2955819.1 DinB family protein [Flammeovirgaceae bacterium]MCZ8069482.1 DinB family protein [Cytophagales bacterium]
MAIKYLLEKLALSFNGKPAWKGHAWHGPSVMATVKEITEAEAANRVGSSHSIIELVLHMIAWREFVTQRLKGNSSYKVSKEGNFPRAIPLAQAVEKLVQSQDDLVSALRLFPEEKLSEIVDNKEYDFRTMIESIVHHDLYHTGQIALLKKVNAN